MDLIAATDADLEDIATLVNAAYRGEAGWTSEASYINGLRTDAEALRADLRARPEAFLLTVRDEAGGPLLACVWLEPGDGGSWYLGLLSVRPDLQDRRVGRELLEAAEAFAAARGARRVRLTVVNIRDSLIDWYRRRGYAPTGEIEPFPYDGKAGAPTRKDLAFVVLEKAAATAGA
jgi:ribosomal protein S18 acetylase RimI-like enzyme